MMIYISNNHPKGKTPVGGQTDTMDDPTICANNSVFVASKFNCTV